MGSADGRTWETIHPGITLVLDGIEGDMYAGYLAELSPGTLTGSFLWVDRSDPHRSFVHPETAGVLPMRNLLARSTDGGASWTDWFELDLGPEQGCSCTGPVFEIASGALAFPYETWKAYDDPSDGTHTASLRLSRDGGATWAERIIVATDPKAERFFWDQRIAVHPVTGELVAMFWTHDRRLGQDLPNNIAWGRGEDCEWSEPVSTGWSGQHCQPLALGGDLLAAIHTERTPPGGIVVRLSDDFGRTWRDDALRIYRPAAAAPSGASTFEAFWQSMMTWPFGHPRAVATPEGDILAAWYAGENDVIGMRWARIAWSRSNRDVPDR